MLFEEHRIGNYWNQVRQEWIQEYDYVLIDSRTGYTDIGDICTVLLADVLVLCFVTNYQNVRGIDQVLKRARQARDALPVDRSRLIAIPVGMRDEIYNERDLALKWRGIYLEELGYLFKEWPPAGVTPEEAINQLFVPYVPIVSFGERIPVLEHIRERLDPTSIGSAYVQLANLIRTRLDWGASFGGVAVQVAQKGLELGIERTESERLRSEKDALETQLRKSTRRTYLTLAGLVTGLILTGSFSFFTISTFREQQMEAVRQRVIAEQQTEAAKRERQNATAAAAHAYVAIADADKARAEARAEADKAAAQAADLRAQLQRAQAAVRVLEVRGRASSPVYKAAVTPSGLFFVTLQGDGVSLWDAASGGKTRDFETGLKNVRATGASITISPDGAQLLAASFDASALLWEVGRSAPLVAFRASGMIISAQFSPDGKRVLTVSDDGAIRIWEAGTGKVIETLGSGSSVAASAVFSPDGARVLALDGHTLTLWDVANGKPVWVSQMKARGRGGPALSPDGTRVIAISGDEAQIFDVAVGKLLFTLKMDNAINSAQFSPDGRRILLASDDKTARIFDATTGQQLIELDGHTGAVISASFSPDGTRILTASDDRSAHLWDATSGRSLQVFTEGSAITAAKFFPDGVRVLITAFDGTFQISPS